MDRVEADSGGRTAGAGMSEAQGAGSEREVDSLRETNARLVDTLQQLQRERAGDALEGVLAEVDRAIGGMLTYVEDLRRTREKLVRGVGSVADRLAEIDTRSVLGSGDAARTQSGYEEPVAGVGSEAERDVEAPTQSPAQPVYAEQSTKVEPTSAQVDAEEDVSNIIRPEAEPVGESAATGLDEMESPGAEAAEDERTRPSLPVDLVVHGCKNFELVGKLQAKVSGLAVVESMRVRRFHRGSLYMTVSHGAGDLAEGLIEALAGLEVDGKWLRILESGAGRIEATFPG
jgi:hypothetical protein